MPSKNWGQQETSCVCLNVQSQKILSKQWFNPGQRINKPLKALPQHAVNVRRCVSKAQIQLFLFHLWKMNSSTLICSRHEQTCAFAFHSGRADTWGHVLPVRLSVVFGTVLFIFICKVIWGSGMMLQCCHLWKSLSLVHPHVNYFRISCPSFWSCLATRCQMSQYKCFVSWPTTGTHHGQRCLLFSAPFGRCRHHNHVGSSISFFFVYMGMYNSRLTAKSRK